MNLPTAIALTAILAALILATGASLRSERNAKRLGSLCPTGTSCKHIVGPALSLRDVLKDGEDAAAWLRIALVQRAGL